MKKVSVFTVLTCFLAGAAHFPCYAGNFFGKEEQPDDRPKRSVPQASKSGGQSLPKTDKLAADGPSRGLAAQQQSLIGGSTPSHQPKPLPSPAFPHLSPPVSSSKPDSDDLDPKLLSQAPKDFLAASEEDPAKNSSEVKKIEEDIRSVVGDIPGLVIHVHLPSQLPLSSSILPGSMPVSQVMSSSHGLPLSDDTNLPPAQQLSQIPSMHPTPYPPHGDPQPPLSIPSSSRDLGEVCQVTHPVSGWALTLPMTLKPIQILNTRGQLVRLPKVLDLCIYPALADVTHSDFKILNSRKALEDSDKPAGFNLINSYLVYYGGKFGQDVTAIANCLKQAIESSNGRPVSFKICQNKVSDIKTALFMLQVEGGAVIIGKVPGQDF